MRSTLPDALALELGRLKERIGLQPLAKSKTIPFVDKVLSVADHLIDAPHSLARDIAAKTDMDQSQIKLAYKLIQRTKLVADLIKASHNGDYLNIVNHYFNTQMYVVVFFVGLSCPSRCVFCPNVNINSDGTRDIARYPVSKDGCLSPGIIRTIFQDIRQIRDEGNFVLVKISGGLEPLTDTQTMSTIVRASKDQSIPVKLFTNGLLLNSKANRTQVLKAGDVRISLSIIDEDRFGEVMFGSDTKRRAKYTLKTLLSNIASLVKERNRDYPNTKIGINSIVLEENHRDMEAFVRLAFQLGVDYIDFKPNYFSPYREETDAAIQETVDKLKKEYKSETIGIYCAKSLFGKNLYWTHRRGVCHPHKQARYKMFITPHGGCTPIHHGAFPTAGLTASPGADIYSSGVISRDISFLDILNNMPELPSLPYERLNPFEHMLALEIEREEKDTAWGIPTPYSPYNFPMADTVPDDLKANPVWKHL